MSTSRLLRGLRQQIGVATLAGRFAAASLSIVSIALIVVSPQVRAQERFGSFVGTVTDPTGAVLPGASVRLVNKESGREFKTTTDGSGSYVFRDVEPGRYRFTFEQTGFGRAEIADALVVVGQQIRVDVTLQVGTSQQTVQVSETAPLIDVAGVTRSNNITAEEFSNLPKSRSFQSLALLAPSVNSGEIEGGFQINGSSGSENQFFIDGVTTNSLIDGRSRQNSAFEFIQEVQVLTGGIDAQYGGATGGVINAVTRSGGNRFHGEAHYYYFGNAMSAGPVQRLLLLDQFGTGVNPSYQQDNKPKDDTHEFGGSVAGPILKDKLFFFSSYSPQIRRRSNYYLFSNGKEPDTLNQNQTTQQLFNKLTYTPLQSLRINANWLWTPTRTEGLLPGYDGYGNSVITDRASEQSNKTQGWTQPQSNYSAQIDWTLTPTMMLTFKGGRFWDNFRTWGVSPNSSSTFQTAPTGIVGLPPDLANQQAQYSNLPRRQNTFYDIATRTYYQIDFSKYVGSFWGSHDIKAGGGTIKNVNKVNVAYPGGGYVFVFWNRSFTPTGALNTPVRGTYGYYEVDDIATRGTTGGTMNNIYLQDRWRIHPRVALTLGLRTEDEHVPSFRRDIRDNAFSFGFQDKLSPRVGISWDVFGTGKLKLYGSYDRLYNWVPYELSRGNFGGDIWTVRYRSLDTLDVLSLSGTNTPGRNLWPYGPYRDRRVPNFNQVDPNLKPFSTDLINAGAEYQLAESMVVRANFIRNDLVRAIEDMGTLVNGDEVYQYVNPGEGIAKTFISSGATPTGFPTPKPQRTYTALELSLTKRLSRSFSGGASYVRSKLYGNYPGIGSSDEITTPTSNSSGGATSQQVSGSIARPGTSSSRAWDLDEYLFDSRGNFVVGNLATDRPNVFKVYGNYSKSWGHWGSTDFGGFFYGASGTPVSTFVHTTNDIDVFVNGRGDLGRTPHLTQTDLMIAQEFRMGETKRIRFEFNATNVFNQKTPRHIFDWLNRGAGRSGTAPDSAINLANVNLFNGYDYNALIRSTVAGNLAYDPRFGMSDLFNPGFQGRFLVKFIF
jgi:Carboxypeptidase regulatory-like domain/TonB-dependent Receptor Plug Domain